MFWSRRARRLGGVATRFTASSHSSSSSNPGSGLNPDPDSSLGSSAGSSAGSSSVSGFTSGPNSTLGSSFGSASAWGSAVPNAPTGTPTLAPRTTEFVRRHLSRENARGLEILGHAIEYLADEYAVDTVRKGWLGNADPRIEAIQILKGLNRAVYFSGTEVQPPLRRILSWLLGERTA
ncbi:MAG: hypothetical protein WA510_02080 [Acidobacteriaceae bacterium]